MAITLSRFMALAAGLQPTTSGGLRDFRAARNHCHAEVVPGFKSYVLKSHQICPVPIRAGSDVATTSIDEAGNPDHRQLAGQCSDVSQPPAHLCTADMRRAGEGFIPVGDAKGAEETAITSDLAPTVTPVDTACRSARRVASPGCIAHHGALAWSAARALLTRSTVLLSRPPRPPPIGCQHTAAMKPHAATHGASVQLQLSPPASSSRSSMRRPCAAA
jgi:hypothetical protein